jgi:hypothetical protein
MIDVMGGEHSIEFARYRSLCVKVRRPRGAFSSST